VASNHVSPHARMKKTKTSAGLRSLSCTQA
jgi:hypothetical protein